MEEFQQRETSVRYMMFIKHPGDYDVKNVPPALFGAMGQFVEEEINKGVFVDGAGLQPLSKATRVSLASGQIKVMDGPFSEAKEVVGGYALCECKSHAEAVDLARRFMELHRIHWPEFRGEAEVRPLEDTSS
jgi:hypothetical protein